MNIISNIHQPLEHPECVFCKIIAGNISSYRVYEDKHYIGILPLEMFTRGHVLIIPKEHCRWVWDSPDIGGYFHVVQRVARALKTAFDTEMVMSVTIGDEVPHAHVHLVPRHADDGHGTFLNTGIHIHATDEDKKAMTEIIRAALAE